MREILLLRLRDAIAEKEWIIAQANRDLSNGGWTCDWNIGMRQAQAEVNHLIDATLNA